MREMEHDSSRHDAIINVVLADDHPVVREGLRMLVNSQLDMHVVGEADNGEAACRIARELQPAVVVMDLSMPRLNGAQATQQIRRESPGVRVLALTVHEEQQYVTELLRNGANGYVLKRAAAADLVQAIRVVASGGTYIDPSLAGKLLDGLLHAAEPAGAAPDEILSDRERDVLIRIARGFSNKEIAAALGISVKTVETYKARVTEKLSLNSRVEIVRFAARLGWLNEPA